MADIEYFYAAHSVYAYLGSMRLMDIARKSGRRLVHKPVDLDRVLEGCGSTAFGARPLAYRNYFFNRELERWAEFREVPTLGRRPTYHHHSPDLANRVLIAAIENGHCVDDLAHSMLKTHWAQDADLADAHRLKRICQDVGLDGDQLLADATRATVQEKYRVNTDEAIERHVFGSPTYFADGDMFYGQDRLELLERALNKPFAKTWPPIPA